MTKDEYIEKLTKYMYVEILGVYSSVKKAEKNILDDVGNDYEYKGFHIEEFELDD